MFWIILGTVVTLVVTTLLVLRSSIKAPKDGIVRKAWANRKALPSLMSRVPHVLIGAMFKKEGRLYPGFKDFPETHFEIGSSEMEVKHLERYNEVCGYKKDEKVLPPCYPVMAVFLFQPYIVSMPAFPVSPLGVVHIRTVLTQHKVLKAGVKLSYQIDMKGHRDTERGLEVDFVIKASLESGEVVWNCIETMLSRKRASGGKKKPSSAAATEEGKFDGSVIFSVPENTGRKYAAVTGDYNPHHTSKIGAVLFGFKKPIAHGQWSLERCLAHLNDVGIHAVPPFKVDCNFKLPIFMPGKCLARWKTSGAPKHSLVDFELRSADGVLPHLSGKLENLDQPGTLE